MGTVFTIRVSCEAERTEAAKAAAAAAFARVEALNRVCSDYLADSELILLQKQAPGQPWPVSADLMDVLRRSLKFSEQTEGAFDVTVGPMIRQWRLSRQHHRLPTEEQRAEARATTGWRKLHLDTGARTVTFTVAGMRLGFGAIAKGYAADEALRVLREAGFPRAVVAASGDIVAGGAPHGLPGWRVGIQSLDAFLATDRPEAPDRPLTSSLDLVNAAVSTSGDTRQAVEIEGVRYSHIIDPATGLGLTERIGVTVRAPDATTSDALATAFSVMGLERTLAWLEQHPEVSALIVTEEGKTHASTRWPTGE